MPRVTGLESFEHELDALHIDVGNTILEARDDLVSRVEHVGVAILGEVGGDFQNKFPIVFIVAQPFDKGLHYPHHGVAMGFYVGLGAGEAAARVVKTELAHVDELVEAKPFSGDILWRDKRGGGYYAFAQGGQTCRSPAYCYHREVAVGNQPAVSEYETDDAVFLGADRGNADFLAFEIGDGLHIGCREDAPIKRVDAASKINRVSAADGGGNQRCAAEEAQRHLAGDHRGSQDRAALYVHEIDVETILFEQSAFAHDLDNAERRDWGGVADDEFFELLGVGGPDRVCF